MIKNYFKIAWRNILKNKFYTLVNLTGLTAGLAIGLLILLWVNDELSFDRFNTKAGQIYQINSQIGSGTNLQVWPNAQPPLADHALKEVPGVKNAVRIIPNSQYSAFRFKDKILVPGKNGAFFVDQGIFKMFDFKLLKGDRLNPFPNNQSIIISASTARNYFGDDEAVGKVLTADNKDNYTVSGVMADFPRNSSIKADIFFSMELKRTLRPPGGSAKSMDEEWNNFYAATYLELLPGVSAQAVADKMTVIALKHLTGPDDTKIKYLAQPLPDVHLYGPDGTAAGKQTVDVFVIVAILILLIASINYVNLSTARAMLRSKEVSMRKIIGAARSQLFVQFLVETITLFCFALIAAFGLVLLLLPLYNDLSGKEMHIDFLDGGMWKMIGFTISGTLLASSIYPALLLSSFKPLNALRGKFSAGTGNNTFRKVLVVCQFIFSISLIIGTLVINGQLTYIREKDLGYDKSYVIAFPMKGLQKNYEAIRAELLKNKSIVDVASSSDNVITAKNTTSDVNWEGKESNSTFLIHMIGIDSHYIHMFNLKNSGGELFTGIASDSSHFILNETAVKEAGLKDPVGKPFTVNFTKGTIIGVIKDFHFASLKQKIEPAVFIYRRSNRNMFVKSTGRDAPGAIKALRQTWERYNQEPFNYKFLDEYYNNLYKSEITSAKLFSLFAGMAILISCLGLLGLASYTAQVKIKEIGIRKVLGATVTNIVMMLSREFIILVGIAIIVAVPVAWLVMQKWLESYAYRTGIHWWIMAIAGLLAVTIALCTIAFQSVKAALVNPVKSLRNE